jgi:hypothetical protein
MTKPIFVVGGKHSGTTLTATILGSNSRCWLIPMESGSYSILHIENLRNACIGKISEKLDKTYKEIYGEKKAIELKKKLSEAHKGQFIGDKHPQAKPIAQYTKSGEYIQEFGSATTAANVLNLSAKSIRQCTNNKIKTSGGFIWKHKI